MKNNNTEKKSLKERVMENKGKIIAGVSIVALGTITYMVYRNNIRVKGLCKLAECQGEFNGKVTELSKKEVSLLSKQVEYMKTTREIAEEGALEEAIKSINKKIQYRIGKIDDLKLRPLDEDAKLSKEIYEKELKELIRKRDTFNELWDKMVH